MNDEKQEAQPFSFSNEPLDFGPAKGSMPFKKSRSRQRRTRSVKTTENAREKTPSKHSVTSSRVQEIPIQTQPVPSPQSSLPTFGNMIHTRLSRDLYVCPYCEKADLNELALCAHVFKDHASDETKVVCPICASRPGGDPTLTSRDFAGHLRLRHCSRNVIYSRVPVERQEVITSGISVLWFESRKSHDNLWRYLMYSDIMSNNEALGVVSCALCVTKRGRQHVALDESTTILPCGHMYHSKCVELQTNSIEILECPKCNGGLQTRKRVLGFHGRYN